MKLCATVAVPLSAAWVALKVTALAEPLPPQPNLQTPGSSSKAVLWDQQAAAKYLDDRMDLWFAKARKLDTREGKTSCISCHTTVPYALARPALRRARGQSHPTPQETKLLDETLRRVNSYGQHELLSKGKAEQSRGSEAVLNVLILGTDEAFQNRLEPTEPTRQALNELWAAQRADGAWDWLDTGMEPYETADSVYYGAALAAMAVGTVPGYANGKGHGGSGGIGKLCSYLKARYTAQNLHGRVWALLASTRLTGWLSREQAVGLAAELQSKQNPDGGWSLYLLGPWTWSQASQPYKPKGNPDAAVLARSDAYATGLIAYTLRQADLPATQVSLDRAIAWLAANQQECQIEQGHWKCWRAYSLNFDTEHGGEDGEPWRRMFMSDGATAFAALALLSAD